MRIILLTQNEPFYLAENIDYLVEHLPAHSQVVACVLFDVSPFGKKQTLLDKMKSTWSVFGPRFFLHYALRFAATKLNKRKQVPYVLKKHGIPDIRLPGSVNSEESLQMIRAYSPDLLVSIAGNQIFKNKLITLAPKGCLNLHTALLPRYRGLMPSFWVLRHAEKKTGVSVFFVDEGIDSGPILVQKEIEIGNRTLDELITHTKRLGMDAILEAIELINKGGYQLMPNDESQKTYFTFPKRSDVAAFLAAGKRFH